VVVHVVVGLALGLGSLALIFPARRLQRRTIIAAVLNGASCLEFNDNISSMIMASGFAAALLSYVAILVWLPGPEAMPIATAS
jgi:hypothetical protein